MKVTTEMIKEIEESGNIDIAYRKAIELLKRLSKNDSKN
tara:strand:+ start:171 stop:287 length:117 start_codon:yes stop_codon:yes gene_type:complete